MTRTLQNVDYHLVFIRQVTLNQGASHVVVDRPGHGRDI